MKSLTRKDFLRLSSLGVLSALIPFQKIEALSYILKLPESKRNIGDFELAMEKAAQAKIAFYKKDYNTAETLYKECIKLAPAAIRFYDNLDNVLGAQGRFIESVYLYQNGLSINPSVIAFYDRTARALARVELGYKRAASLHRSEINSASLLQDALSLYISALKISPGVKYLIQGRDFIQYKIDSLAVETDYRNSPEHKILKKNARREYFNRFKDADIPTLLMMFDIVTNRKRTPLYFKYQLDLRKKHLIKQQRFLLNLVIDKNIQKLEFSKAADYSVVAFDLDERNSTSISRVKSLFYRNKKFTEFISFQSRHANATGRFYSRLGLMEAYEISYLKGGGNKNDLIMAIGEGEDLLRNSHLSPEQVIEVINKLCKIHLMLNNLDTAKMLCENIINILSIKSPAYVDRLFYLYGVIMLKFNEFDLCEKIIRLNLFNEITMSQDIFEKLINLNNRKSGTNLETRLSLYYLLHDLYLAKGEPSKAHDLLLEIKLIRPEDKFVLKRLI